MTEQNVYTAAMYRSPERQIISIVIFLKTQVGNKEPGLLGKVESCQGYFLATRLPNPNPSPNRTRYFQKAGVFMPY